MIEEHSTGLPGADLAGDITRLTDGGAPQADVRVVVDPVCKMKVRTEKDAIHATVDGADYYFCSEVCRDAFVKDPHHFVAAP